MLTRQGDDWIATQLCHLGSAFPAIRLLAKVVLNVHAFFKHLKAVFASVRMKCRS